MDRVFPIPSQIIGRRRSRKWYWAGGASLALAAAIGSVTMLWDWNWFRPLVEMQATAAIGREVTIERLEVHPGLITVFVAHGLHVANPAGFDGPDFAVFPRLSIAFDGLTWVRAWHGWRAGTAT